MTIEKHSPVSSDVLEARVDRLEVAVDELQEGQVELRVTTGQFRVDLSHIAAAIEKGFAEQKNLWGKHQLADKDAREKDANARADRAKRLSIALCGMLAAIATAVAGWFIYLAKSSSP